MQRKDAEAVIKGQVMSERRLVQQTLTDFISNTGRFTAPYGILENIEVVKGRKVRSITFGIARISDIHVRIFSPHYITVNDSRFGWAKAESVQEAIDVLKRNYSIT